MWGNFQFLLYCYIDHARPLNVVTRNAYRVHTDYHLVQDPSEKTVVDLGSHVPSPALETTLLAPETRGPSTTEVFRSTSASLYAGTHVSPGFTRPCPCFPDGKPPARNALLVPKNLPQHPPQLVVQGTDSHSILCLLYTSPSPRDGLLPRMPSSA